MAEGSVIVPPVDQVVISIDNQTGQVSVTMTRPLPFVMVATVLGKILGQLGSQVAENVSREQLAAAGKTNGSGVHK